MIFFTPGWITRIFQCQDCQGYSGSPTAPWSSGATLWCRDRDSGRPLYTGFLSVGTRALQVRLVAVSLSPKGWKILGVSHLPQCLVAIEIEISPCFWSTKLVAKSVAEQDHQPCASWGTKHASNLCTGMTWQPTLCLNMLFAGQFWLFNG